MRRLSRLGCLAAIAGFLALAAPADARKFQMSGTWLVRQGALFVPLQFGGSAGGTQMTHRSMGLFTEAPFYPKGQVVSDVGGVSAKGSAPATLRIPRHRFAGDHELLIPLQGGINPLLQITTMLAVDAPYATASLMASGGPGSFTWCPSNPACAPAGPPPGPVGGNGRIIYKAGARQFGGTMQLGLRGGGLLAYRTHFAPLRVAHWPWLGAGSKLRALATGAGGNDAPHTGAFSLPPAYVTAPTMFGAMSSPIFYPGPFVTTLFGNTATMPSGVKRKLTAGMGAGYYATQQGFPHTTGTVFVQQNTGTSGDDFFAVMGSDARTPLGAGNIALVAGGLVERHRAGGVNRGGAFQRVSMSLAAPVSSLSPAGAATAEVLILLAVGYALRRRLGERPGG